ncbi:hypothetical protein ACI2JR_06675 [Klebsiella sp. NPDC088457]
MIKDYLIIAYLTALACWPVTLTLVAVAAGALLYTGHRLLGLVTIALFVLVAFAAWQFERYL